MKSASPWPLGIRTSGLGPAARRARLRGVATLAGVVSRQRPAASTACATAWSRASSPRSLGVFLPRPSRLSFLDLVAAGVGNLVAEIAQLGEIAPERAVGDSCLLRQLERVETRLGDDRGEHPEQPSQTLSSVHDLPELNGAAGRTHSGRPPASTSYPLPARCGEVGVPRGRTSVLTRALLADFFPGRGGIALERIGLGLLLVADLLVEPAGDHLVGHRLRDSQLRE